jgi:transcription antitermination protein NusB
MASSKHQPPKPFAERARARKRALQAIYQWQINRLPASTIVAQFEEEQDMAIADREYFRALVEGVARNADALDAQLATVVDRALEHVDAIERAVLRLAAYELLHRPDVPYKVVINEAVELARDFGAVGGHSYVNGVVDKLAQQLRAAEVGAG